MTDNKKDAGSPNRKRIYVNEKYELRDWAETFGVSQDKVREAVTAVGDSAEAVRDYLAK